MSFLRLLLLAGIIWLIYYLFRKLTIKKNHGGSKYLDTTPMVRCRHCNVYIVRQDAYMKDNNYYCSHEHYEKQYHKDQ